MKNSGQGQVLASKGEELGTVFLLKEGAKGFCSRLLKIIHEFLLLFWEKVVFIVGDFAQGMSVARASGVIDPAREDGFGELSKLNIDPKEVSFNSRGLVLHDACKSLAFAIEHVLHMEKRCVRNGLADQVHNTLLSRE